MKILVCISRTADTTAKIAFTSNNTKFDETDVQFIINPYDEWYALVRALELKEKIGATVQLISVGGPETDPLLRRGLSYGLDSAVRVNCSNTDPFQIASQIAVHARSEGIDLILTGKETIDYNGSSVGGMVAALLGIPFISLATKFDLEGSKATVHREMEGGEETCEADLPLVVSCQKGVAEMRMINIRGIQTARSKPFQVLEPEPCQNRIQYLDFELPQAKAGVKLVPADQPEELVRLLHEEARVI
ncbi:MAG TPA: electron transfer flavoprotein subunit beta/FixA family protein [Chitinophagaceae bacterium]|nr:electron transfer flavoprotein subunit beta/FixA family protein [Chitinophagaceae bacterium]